MAVIDLRRIAAVLFETDGVITDTARVHAAVWKRVMDAYLRRRAAETGEPWRPFDVREDYLRYVDGKPRLDGARDFLASRGVRLPAGEEGANVLAGLACLKEGLFLAEIRHYGVAPFPAAVVLLRDLRRHGARVGAVSPSRNCAEVLARAGLARLVDARVDGVDAASAGLPAMPDPAMLAEAAGRLGTAPHETAVVAETEPALRAARAGHFGLVVAVRSPGREHAGPPPPADHVVPDLAAVQVSGQVPLAARAAR
ncbi:HAD family hydrolase [Nonomuraea pusilla]|uniref:HAD family hydrolase n=1 Tax=Nonomuraea pusilla TaxID=46177 RepID=UPI00332052C2